MRARWLLAMCSLLGCDPNVVDAVREPPPMPMQPEAGAGAGGAPEPEPEPLSPLQTSLIHRYSFSGDGTQVLDSKGAAHGDVVGAMLAGDGSLALAGLHTGQYVNLPNGLISGLSSATFEAWLTWEGGGSWQRIFDFGTSSAGEDMQGGSGVSYLFLTTASGADRAPGPGLRAAFSTNGVADEEICHGPADFPVGVETHVALVIDPARSEMLLYQDGTLLSECALTRPLSLIDDVNNWLGHSNYVADADLGGTYDEFRIYAAALTADELAESFVAGPDAKP